MSARPDVARAGDLALVIGYAESPVLLGKVVRVLSDPQFTLCEAIHSGRLALGWFNEIETPHHLKRPWPFREFVMTRYLLPIRDPDAAVSARRDIEVHA